MRRSSLYKKAVRKVIRGAAGPLSAVEVQEFLRDTGIGMATIYRHLNEGVEDGELVRVELPKCPTRFEPADRPHHLHFGCDACNRIFNVMGNPGHLAELVPDGFILESHELLLHGRCPDCAKKKKG